MADEKFPDVQRAGDPSAPEAPAPAPVPERDPSQGIPDPQKVGRWRFAVDVSERAIATYLESLLGLLIVAEKIDIAHATAAAVAAVPAGLSVLKSAMARFLGDKSSAAFIPRRFPRVRLTPHRKK
ncbi:hypothetical protein ACFU0X_10390 [Streptomyces cellulosae]|uniref:Uncharacterized protein n=1 Tax=Streptomyces cellulosae TaxID=1968 RepID=A0ABW6JDK0_STRCE